MIERRFTKRSTLDRLESVPAGPFLDGFAAALLAEGYSMDPRRRHLWAAAHLV